MLRLHEVVIEFRMKTSLHPIELAPIIETSLQTTGLLAPESGSHLLGPVLASIELPEDATEGGAGQSYR